MKQIFAILLLIAACSVISRASDREIRAIWADADVPLTTDVNSAFWRTAAPAYMDADTHGNPEPKYRTEIRTRWTRQNLYILFVCPYEELYLKPNPTTSEETYQLWDWDVAEAFIGSDFQHIRRYKEFEMSPRGEWIDLDINLDNPKHEEGWKWNSGFVVSARIDEAAHVWYGAMKIPFPSIDTRPASAGNVLRINLFRSQGPPAARHQVAWQAPMSNTFHVPEKFGLLKLVH